MRPRHLIELDSVPSSCSCSEDNEDRHRKKVIDRDLNYSDFDEAEQEELSRLLYDNTGSIINSNVAAAAPKSANRGKPIFGVLRGVDQLTALSRELIRLLLLTAQKFLPITGTVLGLGLLHFYLFRAAHLFDIASHWAAVIGLTGTGFKAGLCVAILLACFGYLATGFARQASAARALSEAEFDTAVWHMRMELDEGHPISSLTRSLQPKKLSYFICAKWATASLRMKKFIVALVALCCVVHHCAIIIEQGEMHQDVLHCIFSLALLVLCLCLLSTDLLAVQWGCVAASCLLCYLLQLAYYIIQHSTHRFEILVPSLMAFRDALDYVPRLDLDRLGWNSGNTGCGPDFISFLITILIDGVCIGVLHEVNAVSGAIRLFSIFGPSFIGLTGVEALALLGVELMPMPCVVLLLFPYLRRLSESEAAFVFTVIQYSAAASSDRRFIYFGANREKFLLQAILLRQMCILSCVPLCKVLYPVRTKLYVSCAGFQYPGRSNGSPLQRIFSGALDGLKLGTLVSKVALIVKLSAIILGLMIDALFHYLSCFTGTIVTIRQVIAFLLKPTLFLFSQSKDSLEWHSLLAAEILTFKTGDLRVRLIDGMASLQAKLMYGNLTGAALQANWQTNLLIARHVYEPAQVEANNFEEVTSPFFAAYMVEETGSLVENGVFINIFFFHCLTGSRVYGGMARKMAFAVLVASLINTRLLWLLTKTAY